MWLHISAVVVVLGCIFQAYMLMRAKRLYTKVGTPSASHNSAMVAICAYHKPNWSCPFHPGGFCDSNGCNEALRIQRQ